MEQARRRFALIHGRRCTRRSVLRGLVALCLAGRARPARALDAAEVGRMAAWAG